MQFLSEYFRGKFKVFAKFVAEEYLKVLRQKEDNNKKESLNNM